MHKKNLSQPVPRDSAHLAMTLKVLLCLESAVLCLDPRGSPPAKTFPLACPLATLPESESLSSCSLLPRMLPPFLGSEQGYGSSGCFDFGVLGLRGGGDVQGAWTPLEGFYVNPTT